MCSYFNLAPFFRAENAGWKPGGTLEHCDAVSGGTCWYETWHYI
jgi:hypothetical protein